LSDKNFGVTFEETSREGSGLRRKTNVVLASRKEIDVVDKI
jgi:hypothetical protein